MEFEELALNLANFQSQIGELSMEIAEITMKIEQVEEQGVKGQVEYWQRKKDELNDEIKELQGKVRELMLQMENAAQ